ncbi:MAG TPA: hypothetical protein VFB84_16515 [Micromonosporaceae bacterium]|nr:hypothetical protein [Micromonosporaceae bacterium]
MERPIWAPEGADTNRSSLAQIPADPTEELDRHPVLSLLGRKT